MSKVEDVIKDVEDKVEVDVMSTYNFTKEDLEDFNNRIVGLEDKAKYLDIRKRFNFKVKDYLKVLRKDPKAENMDVLFAQNKARSYHSDMYNLNRLTLLLKNTEDISTNYMKDYETSNLGGMKEFSTYKKFLKAFDSWNNDPKNVPKIDNPILKGITLGTFKLMKESKEKEIKLLNASIDSITNVHRSKDLALISILSNRELDDVLKESKNAFSSNTINMITNNAFNIRKLILESCRSINNPK